LEILKEVRIGYLSKEEAAGAIAAEVPEVRALLDRYGPVMRKAFLVFLWAVFQILVAQHVAELRDDSATRADVERAVRRGC
jgi:hypothetical protein